MVSVASTGEQSHDKAVMALVGIAHYSSHVMQLALPPLFPILHDAFAVSYTELGLVVTLFYVTSGLGQALAGVLVDRFGAHRLLIAGLCLLSAAIAAAGLVAAYWMLLPLAVLAGLGNSVFHPADLSILSHRVHGSRLGRAYAVHGLTGSLGYATSPLVVVAVAHHADWRIALVAIGLAGLAVAALLYGNRALLDYARADAPRPSGAVVRRPHYLAVIGSPVVLLAFTYFVITAFAGTGTQTFSITALTSGYGLAVDVATFGLTAYLVGSACGILAGGFLADRTQRHHRVAMTGMAVAALLMALVSASSGPSIAIVPIMMLAGMANGITGPSRDVLIRRAAAGAGMGSVFGFVYSGFDLGSSTAPLLFGALIDHGMPRAVFVVVACAFALAIPAVMQVQHRSLARARAAALPAE